MSEKLTLTKIEGESDGSISVIGVKVYSITDDDRDGGNWDFMAGFIPKGEFTYYNGLELKEFNIVYKSSRENFKSLSLEKKNVVSIRNINLSNFGEQGNRITSGVWTIYDSNFREIEKLNDQDKEIFEILSRAQFSYKGSNLEEIKKSIRELEKIKKDEKQLFENYDGQETLDLLKSKKTALELSSGDNPPNSTPTNSNNSQPDTSEPTPPSDNPPNDKPENNQKIKTSLANRIKDLENKPNKTPEEEQELKDKRAELARLNQQTDNSTNEQDKEKNQWLKPVAIIGGSVLVAGLITFLTLFKKKKPSD